MRCPSVIRGLVLSLFMFGLASAASISTLQTRGSKLRSPFGGFSATCSSYMWDGNACILGALCDVKKGSEGELGVKDGKRATNINLSQECFSAFVPENTKPKDEEKHKVLEWTYRDKTSEKLKGLKKANSKLENACQAPHNCYMTKEELDGQNPGGLALFCPGDHAFLLDMGIINDNGHLVCKKSGIGEVVA